MIRGIKVKNGIHHHICKYCHEEFECATVTHCILNEIAVCYEKNCYEKDIKKFNEKLKS